MDVSAKLLPTQKMPSHPIRALRLYVYSNVSGADAASIFFFKKSMAIEVPNTWVAVLQDKEEFSSEQVVLSLVF
jgi:hypothetical protein